MRVDHLMPGATDANGDTWEPGEPKMINSPPRSKGVVSILRTVDERYCFDLSFDPEVAVANTFINNGAFVATAVDRDIGGTGTTGCPGTHPDAQAIVYDQLDAGQTRHDDVSFALMFEDVEP
jgi:hypothetical protein